MKSSISGPSFTVPRLSSIRGGNEGDVRFRNPVGEGLIAELPGRSREIEVWGEP